MRKQYSNEQKKEVVSHYYNGKSVEQICAENNIPRSTLYSWIKTYKADSTDSNNFINGSEFAKMKSSVEILKQKIEVLQKVNCTYSSPLKVNVIRVTFEMDECTINKRKVCANSKLTKQDWLQN